MRKGFVVSAVLYPLLVIALALIMGIIAMSDNRRKILDNMKLEVSEESDIDPEMSNTALYYEIASLKETIAEMQARLSEERLEELKSEAKSEAKLEAFPVGSIFTSTTNTNPRSYIGGTWEAYGSGKTLVGINTSDSDFNSVNKTGGSKNTTLTVENLPTHSHRIPSLSGTTDGRGKASSSFWLFGAPKVFGTSNTTDSSVAYGGDSGSTSVYTSYTSTAPASGYGSIRFPSSSHTHTVTTSESTTGSQGSGTSFTNLQPYITVYFWKRTS